MFTQRNITRAIFWLAFAAFLSVSIPHVAWLYHVYEPDNNPIWWLFSYGIAVGIDVLVCWLSYVQADGNTTDKVVTWLFIGCLACLSWYANFIYAMAHNPDYSGNVWSISLVFGATTGSITPIIVSAVPVFIIGYTYMLSKVGKGNGETLEQKVARLTKEKEYRDQLKALRQGRFTGLIKNAVSGVGDVIQHTQSTFSLPSDSQTSDTHQDTQMVTTESLPGANQDTQMVTILSDVSQTSDTTEIEDGQTGDILRIDQLQHFRQNADTQQDTSQDTDQLETLEIDSVLSRSTSGYYIPVVDISTEYGYSVSYLQKLVNQGTLKTKKTDKTLVLRSSLQRYLDEHGRKKQDTTEMQAIVG